MNTLTLYLLVFSVNIRDYTYNIHIIFMLLYVLIRQQLFIFIYNIFDCRISLSLNHQTDPPRKVFIIYGAI